MANTTASRHRFVNVIHAWAEGKEIQYRMSPDGSWMDYQYTGLTPNFSTIEWRLKPQTVTRWYNLYRNAVGCYHKTEAGAKTSAEGRTDYIETRSVTFLPEN